MLTEILLAGIAVGVGGAFGIKLLDVLEAKTRKRRAEKLIRRKKEQKRKAFVVAHEDFVKDLKKYSNPVYHTGE